MRRNTVSVLKCALLCLVFVSIPFLISFLLNLVFPIDDFPIDYLHQEEILADSDALIMEGNQRIEMNDYVNHDTHEDPFDPVMYRTQNEGQYLHDLFACMCTCIVDKP